MPNAKALREAHARANQRIREAEDSLLSERRRAQELGAMYAEAETVVSPDAIPRFLKESS